MPQPPPQSKAASAELAQCAGLVMETGLLVTRMVRAVVRERRPAGLSLPQFRALAVIGRGYATSPSGVADYLGVVPASATNLVKELVHRGLATQRVASEDARCRALTLTAKGKAILDEGLADIRAEVEGLLTPLTGRQRKSVLRVNRMLQAMIAPSMQGGARGRG